MHERDHVQSRRSWVKMDGPWEPNWTVKKAESGNQNGPLKIKVEIKMDRWKLKWTVSKTQCEIVLLIVYWVKTRQLLEIKVDGQWSWVDVAFRVRMQFFPTSLGSFQLKQKLSNFRLSNLNISNFSFLATLFQLHVSQLDSKQCFCQYQRDWLESGFILA